MKNLRNRNLLPQSECTIVTTGKRVGNRIAQYPTPQGDAFKRGSREYSTIRLKSRSLMAHGLTFLGAVFDDVGQLHLVGPLRGEAAVDEVIVDQWAWPIRSGLASWRTPTDQMRSWKHSPATRFSPAVIPRPGSSSEMKRYRDAGSSPRDAVGCVNQMGIIAVTL